MNRLVPLALLLATAAFACGGSESGACKPGDTMACTCDDGRSGMSTCGSATCDCAPVTLVIAPPAIDFGEVPRGETREVVLLVRNDSGREARLRSAGLLDDASGSFTLPDASPSAIAPGAGVPVTVRFAPAAPGSYAARLRIEPDGGEAAEAAVSGRVPGPLLSCTPNVDFGPGFVGVPVTAAVRCLNHGLAVTGDEARLVLDALEVTGAGFTAAWREPPPAEGLGVGEAVAIEVSFDPADAGPHQGTLVVRAIGGDTSVALSGSAEDPPECELELPPELLVDLLDPRSVGTIWQAIRNRRFDAPCVLRELRLAEGTLPAFSLPQGPVDRLVLEKGGEVRIPVRVQPDLQTCDRQAAGALELRALGRSPGVRHEIPFRCRVRTEPYVDVGPAAVDFGTIAPRCGREQRSVRIRNSSAISLHFEDLALLAGGSDPFTASGPSAGAAIGPGDSASITVGYAPYEDGDHQASLLVWIREQPEPFAVPIRGAARSWRTWQDQFLQAAAQKIDLLVVLDNGTSMAGEAAAVAAELGGLPELLHAEGVDFHLALTTTGLVAGDGCPGGANGGEDGRLVPVDGSRPRILDAASPAPRAAWEANLAAGACHAAPPRTLEAALRAVTPPVSNASDDPRHPEAADGNLGFLRADALLWVVAVSDRADASPETDLHYVTTFRGLKGVGSNKFAFHAVTGDWTYGCTAPDGRAAAPGNRLRDFATSMAGNARSICDDGWLAGILRFGGLPRPVACFPLGFEPGDPNGDGELDLDGELQVFVGGRAVPSTLDGEPVWRFARDSNAICFEPASVPEPGERIDVSYSVAACFR